MDLDALKEENTVSRDLYLSCLKINKNVDILIKDLETYIENRQKFLEMNLGKNNTVFKTVLQDNDKRHITYVINTVFENYFKKYTPIVDIYNKVQELITDINKQMDPSEFDKLKNDINETMSLIDKLDIDYVNKLIIFLSNHEANNTFVNTIYKNFISMDKYVIITDFTKDVNDAKNWSGIVTHDQQQPSPLVSKIYKIIHYEGHAHDEEEDSDEFLLPYELSSLSSSSNGTDSNE